jgi:serine/threonine protein kinase
MLGEGRYLLIALVGEGMTSSVWKAHDRREDSRLVALKTLHPQMLRRDGMVRQFKRGAERMRSLEHPGIVRVLGLAEEEDRRLYFVMELMPGGTLKDLIRHRRLSVDAILPIARALGSALAYAHARKILHRDVEPSNVLFDADGQPRLADFDLALDQGKIFDTGLSHAAPGRVRRARVPVAAPRRPPLDRRLRPGDDDPLHVRRRPAGRGAQRPAPLHRPISRARRRSSAPCCRPCHYSPRRRFATMEAFLAALDAADVAWWRRRTVLIAAGAALLLGALLATCSLALSSPPPPT